MVDRWIIGHGKRDSFGYKLSHSTLVISYYLLSKGV